MQFTIRDLLWLTVVVAFAVLWGGELRQRKIENTDVWRDNLMLRNDRNAMAMELAKAMARLAELEGLPMRRTTTSPGSAARIQRLRSL